MNPFRHDFLSAILPLCFLACVCTQPLHAGRYPATGTQTFTFPDDTTDLGDGTVIASMMVPQPTWVPAKIKSNQLRLTRIDFQSTNSSFKLPDLDPGLRLTAWDTSMQVRLQKSSDSSIPGDGWSLNIGPIPGGNGDGEGGFVMAKGLVIAFDTFDNGNDPPSIEIFADGISVGNFPQTFQYSSTITDLLPLAVHWDASGLDVTYNSVAICTNLPTPGYTPASGHRFAFTGRTSSYTEGVFLDDLLVSTVPVTTLQTGGPVISEFCADNENGIEDENGDSSDWIEIYNGSATAVDLTGWFLTDTAAQPNLWALPGVTVPAYGYLTIFASGKDRSNPAYPLHTNFSLAKTAGYLSLVRTDNTVASVFTYGAQAEDVSYGLLEDGSGGFTYGYLETPTPKTKNLGLQAAGPPAEDVVYLKDGMVATGDLFSTSFTLSIQAPAAPGAVVRYTMNNTPPTATSPVYSTPLTISATTTVRARVYAPDMLPGPIASRTFLQMDATLTNYHGSGQPFSSNLPIIVMDSFNVPVDAYTDENDRPHRLTYAVVIDKNPAAPSPETNRAVITGPADFQGRCGTHVRGETTALYFDPKSYAWELWNNENEDKSASILGFPAESDWVLYAPTTDKTLMRNVLIYDLMRKLNGTGAAMGVKFVEVFFNQDGGALTEGDYRGVYVLIEKIKRNSDRVNIEKLNDTMTDPSLIGGGYLFRKDKDDPGMVTFNTSSNQQFQVVEPEAPNAAQKTWLNTYVNNFEAALNGANFANPTTGYAAYINPLSFVDNQWFVEIAKQVDGYRLSTYFTKSRNGKISCAPVWDYNFSLFNADYYGGDTHIGWYYQLPDLGPAEYYYWPRLHQDPNYKILHWDRYWELRRGLFETTTLLNYIDGLASELVNGSTTPVTENMPAQAPLAENPAMRHFRKWQILGDYLWPNPANYANRTKYWTGPTQSPAYYTAADAEVDAMKSFLKERLAWIDDQNTAGTIIYRPPVFSLAGGSYAAGTTLKITRYTGTAPAGFSYASGGTLYYTTNDTDPRASTGTAVGTPYSTPVVLNRSTTIKARLFANGIWSPLTSGSFMVNAAPASAANLVISEICYKPTPPAPGTAEYLAGYISGNNFEYVELLNVSGGDVDLSNLQLSGGITFSFVGIPHSMLTLAPGARVLVVGNLAAFTMRHGSELAGRVLGTFSGNLNNSGENFTLLDANGSVIANVTYGIAEPWPVAAQDSGYSLVLDNPAPNTSYAPANFHASAQPGGTPGTAPGPAFTGNPAADTDHDGFSDLLEYATGSSPTHPNSINRPVAGRTNLVTDGVTHPYMTFTYRRSDAADGVAYRVELSTTLGIWSSAPDAVTYVGTSNNGDGTSTITWRATEPIGSTPGQFMRLRVTRQ